MAIQSFDRLSTHHKQKIEEASIPFKPSSAPLILHGIATFLGLPAAGVALMGRVSSPVSNAKAAGLTMGAIVALVAFGVHFYKFSQKQDSAMMLGLDSLIRSKLGLNNRIRVEYNGGEYTLYSGADPSKTAACNTPLSTLLGK
ncbi:MAG: hypothetical protein ABSA17_01965 [Rhabdochlamydiaceae bacterium]|jgi:hypothetical protein